MPDTQTTLVNARLSFPDIWKAKAIKTKGKEEGEAKFSAQFLLDKEDHAGQIKSVKTSILEVAIAKFCKENTPPKEAKAQIGDMVAKGKLHLCLHEGNTKEYEGYNDSNMFLSSSSKLRPRIVARDGRTPLAEEDGKPYAGCYVNAVVRLWAQDNNFGKRINAELMGIQFVADGEPFGAAPLADDAFPDLDEGKKKTSERAEEPDDDDEVPF